MYYRYGGSFFGTMTSTNRYVKAYQTDKIPFVVNQSIWFEGEAKFADVILPACTNFERWDISECATASGYVPDGNTQPNHRMIVFQKKCIEPLGESKSDYEIFAGLAKRLGVYEAYTHGRQDRPRLGQADVPRQRSARKPSRGRSSRRRATTWCRRPEGQASTPALRWFAEGRKRDTPDWGPHPADTLRSEGLQTRSGKIEFVASSLKRFEEGGDHRPGAAGARSRSTSRPGRATARPSSPADYPLQLISPHPRFSFHTMGDAKDSWTNEVKDHRVLKEDGRYYWIIRINSRDAATRGIADGDLVRAFNDRGSVILAAQLTERVPSGVIHCYESCADYDPLGTPGESPDRAGCVNILTPKRFITPTSTGMANNSCLIEVERWEG